MWSFNGVIRDCTKHFRGLSTDVDLTDNDSIRLSGSPLRNGDEAYLMDTKKVKLYDEENNEWKPQ